MSEQKPTPQIALDKWGMKSQLEMLQEEATELALAARKVCRNLDRIDMNGNDPRLENMLEEAADVFLVLESLKFGIDDMDERIIKKFEEKKERLKNRLDNSEF